MTRYLITFERIGRKHDVAPLEVVADDADALAEAIYRYARPNLGSRDVEVVVDLDKNRGSILCGFHSGGRFILATKETTR